MLEAPSERRARVWASQRLDSDDAPPLTLEDVVDDCAWALVLLETPGDMRVYIAASRVHLRSRYYETEAVDSLDAALRAYFDTLEVP